VVEGSAGGPCVCCTPGCACTRAPWRGFCRRRQPAQSSDGCWGARTRSCLSKCCSSSWARAVACCGWWRRTRHAGRGRGSGSGCCWPRYCCRRASCCVPAAAADSRGAATREVAATRQPGTTGATIQVVRSATDTAGNFKRSLTGGDGTHTYISGYRHWALLFSISRRQAEAQKYPHTFAGLLSQREACRHAV